MYAAGKVKNKILTRGAIIIGNISITRHLNKLRFLINILEIFNIKVTRGRVIKLSKNKYQV